MPLNEIITETIAKLTQRIDELKTQIGELKTQTSELDTKYTTTYNTSVSLADAIAKMKESLAAQQEALHALRTEVDDIAANTSRTTTTPPTADGTGLPGFVVLDTKPATEYNNYVYIYPRE